MFLARVTVVPHLVTLAAIRILAWLFLANRAVIDPHLVAIAVATLDVSCSRHRCLPLATIAVATWHVDPIVTAIAVACFSCNC